MVGKEINQCLSNKLKMLEKTGCGESNEREDTEITWERDRQERVKFQKEKV